MAVVYGKILDHKKNVLVACLTATLVFTVIYTYVLFEEVKLDDEDAEPGMFDEPSLKSVTVMFRHGERAPVYDLSYPNICKNGFPEGKGHLTRIGKQHMYQKGKLFRRLYNGFMDDMYRDCEITTKSTIFSRTFASAAMVLAGMYPPKYYQQWSDLETVWQPIPISNDSPDRTEIFGTHECPYTTLFVEKDYEKIINHENRNQIEELLLYLTEKIGKQINVEQIHILYDIFASSISNGLQLPEWLKPKHIQLMESVNIHHLSRMYGDKKIQKLISGPLLKEISLNMELRSNNSNHQTTKKMYLYAGHDLSLGTTMYFLGNDTIKTPGFGASIHFHIYDNNKSGYIIKIFYYDKWDDEKGEEISIPICGNPCKLEDFIKYVNEHFSTDWENECEKVET